MKMISRFAIAIVVFLLMAIPCEADGNRQRGGHHDGKHRGGHGHNHHDHGYRWFGVIPRPQWAPYSGYYFVPQYPVPQHYWVQPTPQLPNTVIGAPTIMGVPYPQELETVVVPQEPQSFEDSQKHIRIPEPIVEATTPEPTIPQPPAPRTTAPRRIDPSRAATIEQYVVGEATCPLDLPKGGIVRMCNAKSGKYKLPKQGDGKYFHQQECWFCENILGGDYVKWQDRMQ